MANSLDLQPHRRPHRGHPVEYVYVASSWRNAMQPAVCAVLTAARIEHYDFRNPPGGTGFSWKDVEPPEAATAIGSKATCHCGLPITYSTFAALGRWEPNYDPGDDPVVWRHDDEGYASCGNGRFARPATVEAKGADWEPADRYLAMVSHPVAVDGFTADFDAMRRADTFVLVLPCGKSAHLELGWAVGNGKRTAILLEDPVEPELMYRMVDLITTSTVELLGWLGVED